MGINTNYSSYYDFYKNVMLATNPTNKLYSSNSTSSNSYLSNLLGGSSYSISDSTQNALDYVKGLKLGSADLKSSISKLTSGFSKKTNVPKSSDTESLAVKSAGSSYTGSSKMTVKIDQVAAAQQNEGAALKASDKAGAGKYEFSVDINGNKQNFSINVSETDTNKDMQQKMADVINKAGLGITASVAQDSKNGTSALNIKSDDTGDSSKNVFKIADVSGDAVAKTGASNTTQEAQDAIYKVNGETKISSGNEVNLGNGIQATLKKASDEEITVSRSYSIDEDSALKAVKNMVDSYNSLYKTAVNNSGDTKASRLFNQMVSVSKTYSSSLAKLGIGFNDDGQMVLDETKLEASMDDGSLERFFTQNKNTNYGFTSRLSQLADKVSNNTASYVSKSTISGSQFDFESYLSMYSSALGGKNNSSITGLLFNLSY